jgi:hypothetical protein
LRAVGLLSGGLDSTLAIKLMLEQGIEISAFNLVTVFCCCTPKDASCSAARTAVRQLGVDLKVVNATQEFLPLVADPKHGRGSGMNPCLDCRIMMFRKAGEYMREVGAAFVVTGEVLGQRPMSQRRDAMNLIDRESGLRGLVLRPLSAAVLEPTIPEERGWVDREKLLAITGRSRKTQMALAEDRGLYDYPCPAGGCLLTDPVFSERMRDLLDHEGRLDLDDVRLLKVGRHFRLSPYAKAVVGRNRLENEELARLVQEEDTVLQLAGVPGPLTLVRGEAGQGEIRLAAAMTARYGKGGGLPTSTVLRRSAGGGEETEITVVPIEDEDLAPLRVGGTAACDAGRRPSRSP